jgi:hypothetical protein
MTGLQRKERKGGITRIKCIRKIIKTINKVLNKTIKIKIKKHKFLL